MRKLWLLLPILLSACGWASNEFYPGMTFATDFPPPGPPNYQQGMNDGCKTALGASGSGIFGLMYSDKVHYDVDKALNDEVYYKAWKDAYFYCKFGNDRGPE